MARFSFNLPSVEQVLNFLGVDQLFELLLKRFPVIRKLLDLGQKIIAHFTGTLDAGLKLVASFESEIAAFKNFKEDFRFRQRVVQLERAITKISDLVRGLVDSWRAVLDIIKNITTKIEVGGVAEIAEAATGIGLPVAVVNGIVLIVEILDTIRNVIDDLQTIIDEITRLRLAVEKADTIFLPQSNKRKRLYLESGKVINVRIGKLHPS